jgi:p-hydroxybenzoate 3-monooxygenase
MGRDTLLETQVGIIGAGPAGLLLSHLLQARGIHSVVLESHSRAHVEGRIRAGVLEQGSVDTLVDAGVGARLMREGMVHHGIELRFAGVSHRIAFEDLVPGRAITIYGQHELVKDLNLARLDAGASLLFEAPALGLSDAESERPRIRYRHAGREQELGCEVIVGSDGSHGVSREWMPQGLSAVYERQYPFAWLGVLAQVAPSSPELVYAQHERGFALHSMRSPSVSRFYLQVSERERIDDWSDERIWSELRARLESVPGWRLATGPILEKGVAQMHSRVVECMHHGRLFLAGDVAHVVPATGAKGLNLAIADVKHLSLALFDWFEKSDRTRAEQYSERRLRHVWQVQHFAAYMTQLLHTLPTDDVFTRRLQQAQLERIIRSRAAATALAENYVGLE